MPNLPELEKKVLLALQEREKEYALLMQLQLNNSLNQIYGEMTKIYDKWAVNGKLTKVQMTAYNKYQTMEKNILAKLDPAIKAGVQTIKKLMPDMYDEAFFRYAWAMDNAVGVTLSYGAVNTKTILAAFDVTNPKNIEIANALKNYGPDAKKKIRSALLNNLSMGKSYAQMAKDLENSMDKIYSSGMTIARTEGQRAINRGQDDAYIKAKENGVEGRMIWDATLDQRTRPEHGAMDGVAKDDDGYFRGAIGEAQYPGDPNLPPEMSINCRCRERFEIDGYSPQLRRTREEGLIPYIDYDNYLKRYHPDWKPGVPARVMKVAKPMAKIPKVAVVPKPVKVVVPKIIIPKPIKAAMPKMVIPKPITIPVVPKIAVPKPAKPIAPVQKMATGIQDAVPGDAYYSKFESAEIVSYKPNADHGINPSYIVDLVAPDGTKYKGVLKIEATGDPIIGEYGTYLVDRALGVNRVPNVSYRDYKFINGPLAGTTEKATVQEFVRGFRVAEKFSDAFQKGLGTDELGRIALLDYVTHNKDRHWKNWMISRGKGKVAAIDNGRALWDVQSKAIRSEPWIRLNNGSSFVAPADVLARIKSMDIDALGDELKAIGIDSDVITYLKDSLYMIRLTGEVSFYGRVWV